MEWIKKLWDKTKTVAITYTWTFIFVLLINQLLFFGFCLNPICLIAAMPHCLAITVVLGTWLSKLKITNDSDSKSLYPANNNERLGSQRLFDAENKSDVNAKVATKKTISISSSENNKNHEYPQNKNVQNLNLEKYKRPSHHVPKSDDYNKKINPNSYELINVTTMQLGQIMGVKATPYLFNLLEADGIVSNDDGSYQVTTKGMKFGGRNGLLENGTTSIFWTGKIIIELVSKYKLKKLNEAPFKWLHHITHIHNLNNILLHGLQTHKNSYKTIDISNQGVNHRRTKRDSINNLPLHDYVPLYLNVQNAMLYQVQAKYNDEVVILIFDKNVCVSPRTIFSYGNAATDNTTFIYDINELKCIDWTLVFRQNWKIDGISDQFVKSKMMSECLIHGSISGKAIKKIVCSSQKSADNVLNVCEYLNKKIEVEFNPNLFFFS